MANLIEKIISFLQKITDAPYELLQAAAIYIISAILGRNWYVRSAAEQVTFTDDKDPSFGKPLNIWYLIIGKTRLTRKTTCINKIKEILDMLNIHSIPDAFSPEALVSDLSGDNSHAAWILDECSGFFEACRKADYMAAAEALLSRLYDCRTFTRSTKKSGYERVTDPYITAFLASTLYLPSVFNERMFRQGFLNRFIFVYAENVERKPERQRPLEDSEKDELKDIKDRLKLIRGVTNLKVLWFDGAAKRMSDAYETSIDNLIDDTDDPNDIVVTYMGGIPNIVKRLAGIHRIARMTVKELKSVMALESGLIEVKDVKWAKEYASSLKGTIQKILEFRDQFSQDRKKMFGDYRTDLEKMLDAIRHVVSRTGNEKVSATQLNEYCSKYGWLSDDRNKVLESLLSDGRLIREVDKSNIGRPRITYRLKRDL